MIGRIALALGLAAALAACGPPKDPAAASGSGASGPSGATAEPSKGGAKAPDFTLPALKGGSVSLSDYFGKNVVLIDFWSTTCDPCMVEMPHIVTMYEKYKDKGFVVLAVSLDGPESLSQVQSMVHDKKMSFPVLLDQETKVIARYNPKRDMPFAVLIDRSGAVVDKRGGYTPGDEKALEAKVVELLK
jgi:peroxiredoxin